ncbi:MAG: Hsp20 family protein [Chloroflexi bacterium]|nr:Hsp20 family protein [Chloroflexota bacterium]
MDRTRVREIRRRLELSQERFAQLLGVSVQTVRRWEHGLTRPLPIISLRLRELEHQLQEQSRSGGQTMGEQARRTEGAGMDVGLGLGGLFKGVGGLFDVLAKMVEEGQEETTHTGTVQAGGGKVQGVYGFSVRLGLGGKPIVEQFGNIKETPSGAQVVETREPLVDVLDEGDRILVVAEMPGIEEEDVQVKAEGDILEIAASSGQRRYHKEVLLPSPVDPEKVTTSYRNGILEVRLTKAEVAGM